jgi:NAD(P) transhydrogenase subunit alpha
MNVGVPKETHPEERRVALTPGAVPALVKAGCEVVVEAGAGEAAGFPDPAYEGKGARIAASRQDVFTSADLVLWVRLEGHAPDLPSLRRGQVVVGFLSPVARPQALRELAERGVLAFALELVPRITRAQSVDALSSMATIAGYKAVILAADALPRIFPLLMTAAGTLSPARVFVLGAGVAGLQAIATARRLGGVVTAYDIRPAVKEQVLSLGAKFAELSLEVGEAEDAGGYARTLEEHTYRQERAMISRMVAESDVVICTAAVPGKRAPMLITATMLAAMRPGSVIVDLVAEQGGNCELTRPGETVQKRDVTILGPVNVPSLVPHHASQMYSKNITSFAALLLKDGKLKDDLSDEILRETLVARDGQVVHPRVREALGIPNLAVVKEA